VYVVVLSIDRILPNPEVSYVVLPEVYIQQF
jgi:hypothetical protein